MKIMSKGPVALVSPCGLLVLGMPLVAQASISTFINPASLAAVPVPQQTITFDNYTVGPLCTPATPDIPNPCVFQSDGVTFTSTGGDPAFNQRPELSIDNGLGDTLTNGLLSASAIPTAPGQFTIGFSGSILGFDIVGGSSTPSGPGQATIDLLETNGSWTQFVVTPVTGAGTFFGAQSSFGFVEADLYATPGATCCGNFLINNVTTSPVPLPASAWLLLSALGGLVVASVPKRKRVEATSVMWL